jgi:transposase
MNVVATRGIDLAKQVLSLREVDLSGKSVLPRTIQREQLADLIAHLPACVIGMEACSGSHEWARRFQAHGHEVRLMAPKFIGAYRKGEKNDGNDAEAICEAVSRPSMRFMPVKSIEQRVYFWNAPLPLDGFAD